jgi:hypothetical protein
MPGDQQGRRRHADRRSPDPHRALSVHFLSNGRAGTLDVAISSTSHVGTLAAKLTADARHENRSLRSNPDDPSGCPSTAAVEVCSCARHPPCPLASAGGVRLVAWWRSLRGLARLKRAGGVGSRARVAVGHRRRIGPVIAHARGGDRSALPRAAPSWATQGRLRQRRCPSPPSRDLELRSALGAVTMRCPRRPCRLDWVT